MPADAIARMGARLCRPRVSDLVTRRSQSQLKVHEENFERVLWHDPRFDKPKKEKKLPVHQLVQIFDMADIDLRNSVGRELRKQYDG